MHAHDVHMHAVDIHAMHVHGHGQAAPPHRPCGPSSTSSRRSIRVIHSAPTGSILRVKESLLLTSATYLVLKQYISHLLNVLHLHILLNIAARVPWRCRLPAGLSCLG